MAVSACADTEPEPEPRVYFERSDADPPIRADELTAATTQLLELFDKTQYFQTTLERLHGWPESASNRGYWFGTWWSGVTIERKDGKVYFRHGATGADNNALRTAPLLVGACFADALGYEQKPLIRKLVRGFNSWSLAMDRPGRTDTAGILVRSHYMPSVSFEQNGVSVEIDYSLNLPGEYFQGEGDQPPTIYVHNTDNPHWGDLWIKNKRSKDDVGHIFQAIGHLPACTADVSPELAEDLEMLGDRYTTFAKRVKADGWKIATVDENWQVYTPIESLALFIQEYGIECTGTLATQLFAEHEAGDLDCGEGLSDLAEVWGFKNDFHQIDRSFHEAAALLAYRHGHIELGDRLVAGLSERLDRIFDARATGDYPLGESDLAELVVMAMNAGVPLKAREVRFLHERIERSLASYTSEAAMKWYEALEPGAPDGEYPYTPEGDGLFWRYLGTILGACASPYLNPTGEPVLDCEAVRK